jgi:hypothetical protein
MPSRYESRYERLLARIPAELRTDEALFGPPFICESLQTATSCAKLEEFARRWREKPGQNSMEALKTDITCAAVTAVKRALADVDPARPKDAARKFKMLDGIADRVDKLDSRESRPLPLAQIEPWARDDDFERIMAGLRPSRDLIRAYQTNRPRRSILAPPRADPLTQHFIGCLGAIWFVEMERPPGASRQGPFVRLLTESWRNLKFEAPVVDTELEAWLGRGAERKVTKFLKRVPEQMNSVAAFIDNLGGVGIFVLGNTSWEVLTFERDSNLKEWRGRRREMPA